MRYLSTSVFNFTFSETPRSNIVPLKYTFNHFVTALHAQINLKQEKASQEGNATDVSVPNDIMFG